MNKSNNVKYVIFVGLCIAAFISDGLGQQLILGNPSEAINSTTVPDNFLLMHNGFILSYNRSRGAPNWVTWHLSASDLGAIDRTDSFRTDPALPVSWRIKKSDYTNSGFDRGHMCPSEDRSDTVENNRETFLMSNMQPQFHSLNGGPWKSLEGYVQGLVRGGLEAYLIAGCYGSNGTVNNQGKVTIPTNCWKIVVLLTEGRNDLRRIDTRTRVIVVDIPNTKTIRGSWRNFRNTTVDELESKTGYDFLATIRDDIEAILESQVDNQ